jgi:hypothetical protein
VIIPSCTLILQGTPVSTTPKPQNRNRKNLAFIVAYIVILVFASILIPYDLWFILAAFFAASVIILVSWIKKVNSHKLLTFFVGTNIVLDIIAIAIWAIAPATQWSIYQLGFTIVGAEAAVAAVLFAVALFGLIKKKKWAPYLALIVTVNQRVFATYVFFPSTAIGVTLIWSLIIIYFAYRNIKTQNTHP